MGWVRKGREFEPVVREDVVPRRLIEPTSCRVNGFHECGIVYRDLRGPETDDGAMLQMCCVD